MKTKMTLREWLPLIGMTISAFLVNTSEFMPIGLLTDISNEFHMTEAQAGVMITAYSWTVTLLSLPLMLLVCRIQPKKLLLGTLSVFAVLSGVVSNFKRLYISCVITYWCGVCTFHFLGDRITGCSSGCGERASVKGS